MTMYDNVLCNVQHPSYFLLILLYQKLNSFNDDGSMQYFVEKSNTCTETYVTLQRKCLLWLKSI